MAAPYTFMFLRKKGARGTTSGAVLAGAEISGVMSLVSKPLDQNGSPESLRQEPKNPEF